jgi:hypothetical protein
VGVTFITPKEILTSKEIAKLKEKLKMNPSKT